MKKTITSLFAVAAMSLFAVAASAQPAIKIAVVDMAKLYDNHYKTVEQMAKLQADKQKAEEEVERMNKELNSLIEEYKNLQEQTTNAALTAEAKSKAQNDAQKKMEEIQAKQNEGRSFIQNSGQSLQQRLQNFRSIMLEEISKVATDVAKRHGATLLFDKAGPSLIGISNVIYSDPGFEITDEVMTEINKDRPAGAPTAPAASTGSSTSSSSAVAPASSGPTINLPIAPKK
jgi:outer membrane protein